MNLGTKLANVQIFVMFCFVPNVVPVRRLIELLN